ncbi:MAG: peptidase, partial [Alloprevotella sp.]|nr:peptidase [Alloprevotella sp.]
MRKLILLLMALLPGLVAFAQTDDDAVYKYEKLEKRYRYRVSLIDKQNNSYSLKKPEAFLSRKALERRKRYGIKLDEYDLPVSQQSINELRSKG